jgi:hypothetical protein
VVPLWGVHERRHSVVAALVLGFDNRVPEVPEPTVRRAIALHLAAENTNAG